MSMMNDDISDGDTDKDDADLCVQRPPSAVPPPVSSITSERPAWAAASAVVTDSYDQTIVR
jgi:hypothetical protein